MIDKELIRQAAEDIDIFEADLSQEYDRIARQRKPLRLWPWAAAACLVIAVGISLPMLVGNGNGNQNAFAEAKIQTDGIPIAQASGAESNVTMHVSPPTPVSEATNFRLSQTEKMPPPTATPVEAEAKTNQECTEVDEMEMMCNLLDEVTQQTIAEKKYEEHLYYTLMEEICTNASNEHNTPELSL